MLRGAFGGLLLILAWLAAATAGAVLRVMLIRLPPGRAIALRRAKSLEDAARGLRWTKGLAFAAAGSGMADTALGPAAYPIFTADDYRCGFFRQYLNERRDPERPDDMGLLGFYRPVSGEVDRAALARVLARIGIRDIALPAPDTGDGPR